MPTKRCPCNRICSGSLSLSSSGCTLFWSTVNCTCVRLIKGLAESPVVISTDSEGSLRTEPNTTYRLQVCSKSDCSCSNEEWITIDTITTGPTTLSCVTCDLSVTCVVVEGVTYWRITATYSTPDDPVISATLNGVDILDGEMSGTYTVDYGRSQWPSLPDTWVLEVETSEGDKCRKIVTPAPCNVRNAKCYKKTHLELVVNFPSDVVVRETYPTLGSNINGVDAYNYVKQTTTGLTSLNGTYLFELGCNCRPCGQSFDIPGASLHSLTEHWYERDPEFVGCGPGPANRWNRKWTWESAPSDGVVLSLIGSGTQCHLAIGPRYLAGANRATETYRSICLGAFPSDNTYTVHHTSPMTQVIMYVFAGPEGTDRDIYKNSLLPDSCTYWYRVATVPSDSAYGPYPSAPISATPQFATAFKFRYV